MPLINRLLDGLITALTTVGMLCVIAMMLHVVLDVICRYGLNAPLPGTLNIVSRYYMVGIVFLSLAAVERQNAQITVEIVYDRLPARLQSWLTPLAWALTSATFTLLTIRATEVALAKTEIRAAVEQGTSLIPIWPSYWSLALGAGALALFSTLRLVVRLLGGRDLTPQTAETSHE